MSIAFIFPNGDTENWIRHFNSIAPEIPLQVWPEIHDPGSVIAAMSWGHPLGIYKTMPNLRCIVSAGAGVDHLFRDPELPEAAVICRIVDPELSNAVVEYVVWAALHLKRDLPAYLALQQNGEWRRFPRARSQRSLPVGIMGMGEIGSRAAQVFAAMGGKVSGWSNQRKTVPGVQSFAGRGELGEFLRASHILICLLPLTPATENILDAELFAQLPDGAFVINAARGAHLVEADLLAALDSGKVAGACLDVFRTEPLPAGHPFWTHPKVIVTPHIAGVTRAGNAVRQIVESYARVKQGLPPLNAIDRLRAY